MVGDICAYDGRIVEITPYNRLLQGKTSRPLLSDSCAHEVQIIEYRLLQAVTSQELTNTEATYWRITHNTKPYAPYCLSETTRRRLMAFLH